MEYVIYLLYLLTIVKGLPVPYRTAPYGYAPYVWIDVSKCLETAWCVGMSKSGFALATGEYAGEKLCTHYCPGKIHALWKPLYEQQNYFANSTKQILGAYVRKLDTSSCSLVPGGFKCSDRIVSDTPMNKISIFVHAQPHSKHYYFHAPASAECGTDPECAAFKVLRRTLYAPEENRTWPDADDVLTLRNSPYACVLSYVGVGDAESIGKCYSQLGDNCFFSQGNQLCISNSRTKAFTGMTNADVYASAPIAMCELSDSAVLGPRDGSKPTAEEIRDFVTPSSCDATVIAVGSPKYSQEHLSLEVQLDKFHVVADSGHVIMRVPFDECLLSMAHTDGVFPQKDMSQIAKTLLTAKVATYATGIMLDASEWNSTECTKTEWDRVDLSNAARRLAAGLLQDDAVSLFLRLPKSTTYVQKVDFEGLDEYFVAFLTPAGSVNMEKDSHCQNMWANGEDRQDDSSVVSYLWMLRRRGVRANRIIFTLSLTGGIRITQLDGYTDANSVVVVVADLSLADMETNAILKCEEDLNTKCCSGSSVTVWARGIMVNVSISATSFETLKRFPEMLAVAFGINQFAIAPVDSDFSRGVRSETPAILGITSAVHRLRDWKRQQISAGIATVPSVSGSREKRSTGAVDGNVVETLETVTVTVAESEYKDPASGAKNCLDPKYNVGLSNTVICPGLIAVHGALGIFKEPHRELYGTSYDKIYIGNIYDLESCTPGAPTKRATVSSRRPQVAMNINTMVPTTDRNHYMVGILDSAALVEYVPPVNKVCVAHNAGKATQNMNLVSVDDGYVMDKPEIEEQRGFIVKPPESLFFVSNFTPGIDYVNFNVTCIDYDVSALQPCLIAICGGDGSCRRDYGRLCNSAHEIVNDARRAGEFLRDALRELEQQEEKAKVYEIPDNAPLPWLDRPRSSISRSRNRRFLMFLSGVAGLGLAWHVSNRVAQLESQTDLLKNSYVAVSNKMIEVSNKLDKNIALVNNRISEQERKIQKNNDIVNRNFALLKDTVARNTEMASRDSNMKLSVMACWLMWYAETQSITHQLSQAAKYIGFLARGLDNCLRQVAVKKSGSCPSGLDVMQRHPGLSEFPTVGTALYKDRKLFIVHAVPSVVDKTAVRGIIPMPKMSTDGIPCWPDYTVWLIDGDFYEPSECYGRYCYKPEKHERYIRCREDSRECKTVCAPCHRGICYHNQRVTWMEGSAEVEIVSPPLKPFSKAHFSDGPVSFADLLKDATGVDLEVIRAINTTVKLFNIQADLDNVSRSIESFSNSYEEEKSNRFTPFGDLLSGFASDVSLWVSVGLLMTWCTALSLFLGRMFLFGGMQGGCGRDGSGQTRRWNTSRGYQPLLQPVGRMKAQ